MEAIIDRWKRGLELDGLRPTAETEARVRALVEELGPVVPAEHNGSGLLLRWDPEGDVVGPAFFERYAEAVRIVERHGFYLSLGRSAAGYTYLNIQDPTDLAIAYEVPEEVAP